MQSIACEFNSDMKSIANMYLSSKNVVQLNSSSFSFKSLRNLILYVPMRIISGLGYNYRKKIYLSAFNKNSEIIQFAFGATFCQFRDSKVFKKACAHLFFDVRN